jgi:hypothetical protein
MVVVASFPHGGLVFFLAGCARGASEVELFASTTSTIAKLGSVAHRGLSDGRGFMGLRRMVALSGVVVALTASFARSLL